MEKECLSHILGYWEILLTTYYAEYYHHAAVQRYAKVVVPPKYVFWVRQMVPKGVLKKNVGKKDVEKFLEPELDLICVCKKYFNMNQPMFEWPNFWGNFFHPDCILSAANRRCSICQMELPIESLLTFKRE